MDVKPGYKMTEVGVIPEDWEVTTVGSEFSIQLGKMLDSEKNAGIPKPYLGNRCIQWGKINVEDLGVIRLSNADIQRFRLREGDLLVCEGWRGWTCCDLESAARGMLLSEGITQIKATSRVQHSTDVECFATTCFDRMLVELRHADEHRSFTKRQV